MTEKIDYEEIELKAGLEFHQRLDTKKLFCQCSSKMEEKPENPKKQIKRYIRPSKSELGKMDPAAAKEAIKRKEFTYNIYEESTCLVETDSEPPHPVDKEAFDLSLVIAKMLNCDIFDEINFMRKTVVDGSNTTGFQRTAMIGDNGHIEKPLRIDIDGVFLEEESAGIIEETKGTKKYRLDRLGIPLIEIATGIIRGTPEEIKEIALRIGTMLRTTGKVKRGLGTIRQDLNLSIKQGNRVEIKGIQEIDELEEIINNEIKRQMELIELKKELEDREITKINPKIKDFSSYFREKSPGFMKKAINKGGGIYGYILPDFKGILGKELLPDHRFGTELAQIAKTLGTPGIIHTDEDLEKYGINQNIEKIRKEEDISEKDSILLIASEDYEKASKILMEIKKRINQATEGVPSETRKFLENTYTQYLRPLGGEKRMYPETDIPTIKIDEDKKKKIEDNVPPKPEEIVKELKGRGISGELAKQSLKSPHVNTIRKIIKETKVDPTTIASTFTNTLKELKDTEIDKLKQKDYEEIFKALEEDKFSKDALKQVIKAKSKNPEKEINKLIEEKSLGKISSEEIEKKVDEKIEEKKELVKENPHRAFKVIMGKVMSEYQGKVNGETVSKILKEKIDN